MQSTTNAKNIFATEIKKRISGGKDRKMFFVLLFLFFPRIHMFLSLWHKIHKFLINLSQNLSTIYVYYYNSRSRSQVQSP